MYPCTERFKGKALDDAFNEIYERLYEYFGPQFWWPADTPFETAVGAILTQSVSWRNVERAINNLKREGLLEPSLILKLENDRLAGLIKPSGYFNMKARKLKAFSEYLLKEYNGSMAEMSRQPLEQVRPSLLKVYGIGPETADSILLYAGNYPIFVIDAYTRRIFHRLGLVPLDIEYHQLQKLVMDNFKPSVKKYNEYHALLVALGKDICKKRQFKCGICPLG